MNSRRPSKLGEGSLSPGQLSLGSDRCACTSFPQQGCSLNAIFTLGFLREELLI